MIKDWGAFKLDEKWFTLSGDLFRKALEITLHDTASLNQTYALEMDKPPSVSMLKRFKRTPSFRISLETSEEYLTFSQHITASARKTSGSDKPRHPVLQMLWGIVTQTNVDHAELLWEEFTQGIQTFFSHKASHKASLKDPKKKVTPLLIPYRRFSKEISSLSQKVRLLKCLEWQSQVCPTTTTPVKQSKPAPAPTKKPSKHKLPQKVRKGKPTFQLIDEDDEAQQESVPQEEGD
ncbi:hypothetical protein Tco_0621812, partial [Tanacetum coccineum]